MVQVGIVGFGRLRQDYYSPALRRLSCVDGAAVADPLPASRAASARLFPIATVHSNYEDLLHRPLDALLVATEKRFIEIESAAENEKGGMKNEQWDHPPIASEMGRNSSGRVGHRDDA